MRFNTKWTKDPFTTGDRVAYYSGAKRVEFIPAEKEWAFKLINGTNVKDSEASDIIDEWVTRMINGESVDILHVWKGSAGAWGCGMKGKGRRLVKIAPSKGEFMEADQIKGLPLEKRIVTIEALDRRKCTFEKGREEEVALIKFKEAEKWLVFGTTNRRWLVHAFGDYEGDCIGKKLQLVYISKTSNGKPGIRFDWPDAVSLEGME